MALSSGELNRTVRVERPVAASGFRGAGSGTWERVADVRVGIRDALPSRGESTTGGMTTYMRPARVRMRYRTDITADMRFVDGDRVMHITSGPAELGRRAGLEFMVAERLPAGNPA